MSSWLNSQVMVCTSEPVAEVASVSSQRPVHGISWCYAPTFPTFRLCIPFYVDSRYFRSKLSHERSLSWIRERKKQSAIFNSTKRERTEKQRNRGCKRTTRSSSIHLSIDRDDRPSRITSWSPSFYASTTINYHHPQEDLPDRQRLLMIPPIRSGYNTKRKKTREREARVRR